MGFFAPVILGLVTLVGFFLLTGARVPADALNGGSTDGTTTQDRPAPPLPQRRRRALALGADRDVGRGPYSSAFVRSSGVGARTA